MGTEMELLYEMANLRTTRTGLPMVIWVSGKGGARHACRIKVQAEHGSTVNPINWITVTVEDEPRQIGNQVLDSTDFALVCQFIDKNQALLIAYWNYELDTEGLIDAVEAI